MSPPAGHTGNVAALAWSPDGKALASAGTADRAIILWDAAAGKMLRRLPALETHSTTHLQFAPDGGHLAAVFWSRDENTIPNPGRVGGGRPWGFAAQVRGWDLASGAETFRFGCDNVVLPPGQSWFATHTYPAPAVWTPVSWTIWGYDGSQPSGGATLGASEYLLSHTAGPGGRLQHALVVPR